MMKRVVLAACAALGVSCQAFAILQEFLNKGADGARDFWSPGTWASGSAPANGDALQIASWATNLELDFSKDVGFVIPYIDFKVGKVGNTTLVFNGDGRIFGVTDGTTDVYNVSPLRFMAYINNGTISDSTLKYIELSVTDKSHGAYRWTDPVFTAHCDEDFAVFHEFSKGTYNFYNPNGTALSGSSLTFGIAPEVVSRVRFAPETSLSAVNMIVGRGAGDPERTVVTLDGTDARVYGNLTVKTGGKLIASEGTELVVSGYVTLQSHEGIVVSNATAKTSSAMTVGGSANPTLTVEEGGVFTGTDLTIGQYDGNSGTVDIRGGTVSFPGADSVMAGWDGGVATIRQSGGSFSVQRMRLGRRVASAASSAAFVMSGGSYVDRGGIQFQQSDGGSGDPVNNGNHMIRLDGGVCKTLRVFRDDSATAGTVRLLADGGTLQPVGSTLSGSPFVCNLSGAEFGPKGLTLDTQGLDTYVRLNAKDADEGGGLFVKEGSADLTLDTTSWTVSSNVVRSGRLILVRDNADFGGLIVSGGTISLAGEAKTLAVASLDVSGGTIELDPGDKIIVKGAAALHHLTMKWTANPQTAAGFLTVKGSLSRESLVALRAAIHPTALAEGRHIRYEMTYDAGTDSTTVTATETADEDIPSANDVSWIGNGAWETEDNWKPNQLPTAENRAVFAAGGKTVSIGSQAAVGALSFSGDGFALLGETDGSLTIDADVGAAKISVAEGNQSVDVPLLLETVVDADVSAGATLTLGRSISGGMIRKDGTGKLVLDGSNSFERGLISSSGILSVGNENALGRETDIETVFRGGTAQFAAAEPMTLPGKLALEAAAATGVTVFDAESDVTVRSFEVRRGAFIKRGPGALTIEVSDAAEPNLCRGNGNSPDDSDYKWQMREGDTGMVFPEDGSAPVNGLYPGFSVAEGELVLKGVTSNACAKALGRTIVGLHANACREQPSLTVDSVDLDVSNYDLYVGFCTAENGVAVTSPTMRILNGGRVYVGETQMGYLSSTPQAQPCIAVTNGTLQFKCTKTCYVSRAVGGVGNKVHYWFRDAKLLSDASALWLGGGIDLDFDHSTLSGTDGGLLALTAEGDRPNGTMSFRNGSVFACRFFDEGPSMNKYLTLSFDDAEWRVAPAGESAEVPASTSGCVRYVMRGAGARMAPDSGCTYLVRAKLEGDGGFVADGPGTVAFGANAYDFSGICDVRRGVVDLSQAGELDSPMFAGSGTVRGGTFASATVKVGDGDLTFAGCTFGGRFFVDLGYSEDDPIPESEYGRERDIARVDVMPGSIKLVGTGRRGLKGTFELRDGVLKLTSVYKSGFCVIIR